MFAKTRLHLFSAAFLAGIVLRDLVFDLPVLQSSWLLPLPEAIVFNHHRFYSNTLIHPWIPLGVAPFLAVIFAVGLISQLLVTRGVWAYHFVGLAFFSSSSFTYFTLFVQNKHYLETLERHSLTQKLITLASLQKGYIQFNLEEKIFHMAASSAAKMIALFHLTIFFVLICAIVLLNIDLQCIFNATKVKVSVDTQIKAFRSSAKEVPSVIKTLLKAEVHILLLFVLMGCTSLDLVFDEKVLFDKEPSNHSIDLLNHYYLATGSSILASQGLMLCFLLATIIFAYLQERTTKSLSAWMAVAFLVSLNGFIFIFESSILLDRNNFKSNYSDLLILTRFHVVSLGSLMLSVLLLTFDLRNFYSETVPKTNTKSPDTKNKKTN